jgi:hypothetical protein
MAVVIDQSDVERIRSSGQWARAAVWGDPRPGHPEGTIGRHVEEQVLPFIDAHYRGLAEYWSLVALAYLHDIGKPDVDFRDGRVRGESHSILSMRIAAELGAPESLQQVIRLNDRAFSHWRKLIGKSGEWDVERWTESRRAAFVEEFAPGAVDLRLLVLFHRADNGYRRADRIDESIDPVFWFENRLVEEGLVDSLPPEAKDQRLDWKPAN